MPIQRVRIAVRIGAGLLGLLTSASCLGAGDIVLFDYGLNRDGGITSDPSPLPSASGFNTSTGLGSFELTFADPGSHSVLFFVDHEMSEGPNSTFNELGGVSAVNPPEGLRWEVDEPGYTFGDIFDHFLFDALDNTIGTTDPEDVSMALGWRFDVGPGEKGVVRFSVSELEPAGFYLTHFDPDSGERIYFNSALEIGVVPELGSQALVVGLGLLGMAWVRSRSRRSH